jgi:dTDP-4-dehydrorhamnose 3,5-epimerase
MPFHNTDIQGVFIFEPSVFKDSRGYFFESYNERIFKEQGITARFVQDNQSSSNYGVIRGLHFQWPPHAQAKLVRVLYGEILDVAVDIRKGSPSYGKAICLELSAENRKELFISPGFAHGFSVLSEKAEVFYKCNALYNSESDAGIYFNDPALNIDWKIPADKIIVSDKDKMLPALAECKNSFVF